MGKILVSITEKHLASKRFCVASECALAVAINELLKDGFSTSVSTTNFSIYRGCSRVFDGDDSDEITAFVSNFDDGHAEPTTISLRIPERFLR